MLEAGERRIVADQVVVATGPFQVPNIPAIAGGLSREVLQMHSTGYRRPADVPEGRVLVVGGGNTGFQIAKELAASHEVHLAIGSRQTPLPQRLLGRDLFWWLTKLGLLSKTVESRLGRRAAGPRHPDRLESAGSQTPRCPDSAARRPRRGSDDWLRRRQRAGGRRRDLGDRLPARPLLDRAAGDGRRRTFAPPSRRHRGAGALLPRPLLATHPRLGATRLRG